MKLQKKLSNVFTDVGIFTIFESKSTRIFSSTIWCKNIFGRNKPETDKVETLYFKMGQVDFYMIFFYEVEVLTIFQHVFTYAP